MSGTYKSSSIPRNSALPILKKSKSLNFRTNKVLINCAAEDASNENFLGSLENLAKPVKIRFNKQIRVQMFSSTGNIYNAHQDANAEAEEPKLSKDVSNIKIINSFIIKTHSPLFQTHLNWHYWDSYPFLRLGQISTIGFYEVVSFIGEKIIPGLFYEGLTPTRMPNRKKRLEFLMERTAYLIKKTDFPKTIQKSYFLTPMTLQKSLFLEFLAFLVAKAELRMANVKRVREANLQIALNRINAG